MTREKEIKEARHEWYLRTQDADFCAGFQKGAEWADRTMIKKACEWLERNYHATPNGGYYYLPEDCIEQFKQAMKGGKD